MNNRFATTLFLLCIFTFPIVANSQQVSFDFAGRAGSGLLPGNEVPDAANSTATGDANSIIFDMGTNELSLDIVWGSGNGFSDLTGDATAMHIHGPADINSNGGVLYNLGTMTGFDSSSSSGGFAGIVTLNTDDVQTLLDGNLYVNIHTAANGGGELRANLIQAIPEPSSLAIIGVAGIGILLRRRK